MLVLACPPAGAQGLEPGAADSGPATGAIRFYQRYLSSLRHGRCRFTPSCSEYAAQAIAAYGLVDGSARAADRLIRCNASVGRFDARGPDGRVLDPVDPAQGVVAAARAPRWLRPAPEPAAPPLPAALDHDRRARLDETVTFAARLAERGDCERAATEYQRVGSLAGLPATDAWAFARIGECQLAASQWSAAERAFLTAGMLAATPGGRARAIYSAAISRFDAGSFAGCQRLLDDPSLSPGAEPDTAGPRAATPERAAALGGLCALALGDWSGAAADFERGAALAPDDDARARLLRLAPFAKQGPDLPHRSPALAATLSAVVPGSGQMYAGRAQDGFRHLVFDAALIWTVVSLARDERVPAAVLTAGIALPFYAGNVIGARNAARQHDRTERIGLLRRAIDDSAR